MSAHVSCLCLMVLLSARTLTAYDPSLWLGPRDRFWRHHVEQQSLVYKGVDYYQEMISCLDRRLSKEEQEEIKTSKSLDRSVGLKHHDGFRQNKVILVVIEHSMTPVHVKAVQSLATCVRGVLPDEFYEARSFYVEMGLSEDPGLGGNNPTHLAPLLGVFFPHVIDEMQRTLQLAYDTAGWSYYHRDNATEHHLKEEEILPKPDEIGFRASEHLTYKDFKEGLADHTDGGDTFYTVNFALSGPDDYDGGFFYLRFGEGNLWGEGDKPPKETLYLKPNKYDCLVFLGGPYLHGVTEMTGGNREMFSSELWNFPDTPFGSNLWINEAERMELYVEKCNTQKILHCRSECTVDMTKLLPDDDGMAEEEEVPEVLPPSLERWCDLESGEVFNVSDFEPLSKEPYFMVPRSSKDGRLLHPLYWREDFSAVANKRVQLGGVSGDPLVKSFSNHPMHQRLVKLTSEYDLDVAVPSVSEDGWRMEPGLSPEEEMKVGGIIDLVQLTPFDDGASQALLEILKQDGGLDDVLIQLASSKERHPLVLVEEWHIWSWTYSEGAVMGPATKSNDTVRLLVPLHLPSSATMEVKRIPVSVGDLVSQEMYWGDLHLFSDRCLVFVGENKVTPPLFTLEDSEFENDDVPFLLSMVVRFLQPNEAESYHSVTAPFVWPLVNESCEGKATTKALYGDPALPANCVQEMTV